MRRGFSACCVIARRGSSRTKLYLLKSSIIKGRVVATVNFSVPADVKQAFNETFADENKSAVLTRLMRQAIEERQRAQRRAAAIDALLKLRKRQRPLSDRELRKAREAGRP